LTRTYSVRRSDRARRSRLTITEDGEVVVVLPRRAPVGQAALLIERHARWLDRHLERVSLERARLESRPALGVGRVLTVHGEPLRVWVIDGRDRPPRGRVERVGDRLVVHVGRDGRDSRVILEAWLRRSARETIADRIAERAPHVGVQPGRVTIRDQSSRWASAGRGGALSFSWRLVLTPPFVLDAVVVHELVHLLLRGHTPAFWKLVIRHAPRTPEARRWLREHASDLRAALT
jgi:predicted metal-dependent hydrolase